MAFETERMRLPVAAVWRAARRTELFRESLTDTALVTESQFSREPNHLDDRHNGGFHEIARRDYLKRLTQADRLPSKTGRWQTETAVATVADWQPR